MDAHDKGQVPTEAAEVYDELFVPALFGAWAPRVAEVAALGPGQRVLDVACGTGVLARCAAEHVGADGQVVGLDPNAGMLAVAARTPGIEWREGVAEELPFPDASFDAVVSQFGLMFFTDRVRALAEMARVLRPAGHLVVAVWARLEETPGYAAMAALLERLFGAPTAQSLHAPYGLGDPDELRRLFHEAGIDPVHVEKRAGQARFPSLESWVHTDIRGWTLAGSIDDAQYERLSSAAREELARFVEADGSVRFDAPALIAHHRRPAA